MYVRAYPCFVSGHLQASRPLSFYVPLLSFSNTSLSYLLDASIYLSLTRRCGLKFSSSGAELRDNVASMMLSGGGRKFAVEVYGTCRYAEEPVDPIFVESLTEPGCSDLKYPMQGHVALR